MSTGLVSLTASEGECPFPAASAAGEIAHHFFSVTLGLSVMALIIPDHARRLSLVDEMRRSCIASIEANPFADHDPRLEVFRVEIVKRAGELFDALSAALRTLGA